ncbi:MAG: hypothetical protein K5744_07775 [Eubacterium sp.]|nr:hypothetical protein [Eubacterium sp.]
MTVNGREVIYNGGPFQSYWWADEHEPVHPAISVKLSDEVDEKALSLAWDGVKKVYPLADLVPDDYDEEILFFESGERSVPQESKEHLLPAGKGAAGRGLVLSWQTNSITLGAYRSLTDETGLMRIFSDLMKLYSTFRNRGSKDIFPTIAEKPLSEIFVQSTMLVPEDYEPQKIALHPDLRELFTDPEAVNEDGKIVTGRLLMSAATFDGICTSTGASPEELLACLLAKTIYFMHPEEKRQLCFGIMTDFRKVFGVQETVAPCSKPMPLLLSREDVDASMETALKKISEIRNNQKTEAYIKSHVAMENTYAVLNLRNVCTWINFTGSLDVGDAPCGITDVSMTEYSANSVFLIREGERIYLCMQYGLVTGKYLQAASGVFEQAGVHVIDISDPYTLCAETAMPVL